MSREASPSVLLPSLNGPDTMLAILSSWNTFVHNPTTESKASVLQKLLTRNPNLCNVASLELIQRNEEQELFHQVENFKIKVQGEIDLIERHRLEKLFNEFLTTIGPIEKAAAESRSRESLILELSKLSKEIELLVTLMKTKQPSKLK